MSLRDKIIKNAVPSPFPFKPMAKKEVTPDSMWAMLEEMAKTMMTERMRMFEAELRQKETDATQRIEAAAEELLGYVPLLKDNADMTIADHIRSRAIEIHGEDAKPPTDADLLALIRPLIPKPIPGDDGHTPTDSELLAIIRPLIPPSKPGKPGSPDTGDQIISKVNASDKFIDRQRIRGLEEAIKNISRASVAKKGGGMGNVLHEPFNVSSATTTITTASRIAGGGNALWVTYNGQDMTKGTDYTVGSNQRTITLLFTPQDSTVMQVTYIRT